MKQHAHTRVVRSIGLARALSKLGYCSRAQAFLSIRAGKIKLNGRICRDGETPVMLGKDSIEVEGRAVTATEKIYLMLNKPRGLVTTTADEKGRDTVYSCLPTGLPYIAPVGRLDKASEGLLLMTNDSEWAARVTDPSSHLPKTYHVQVAARPRAEHMAALRKGIAVKDGEVLRLLSVQELRHGEKNAWLEIVLEEGKNRHIRRMMEALGVEVLRLVRVAIGPLQLGNLAKGEVRRLTHAEVAGLHRASGL